MGATHTTLTKWNIIKTGNNLETLSLVWLNDSTNNTKDYMNVQEKLRTAINHLKIFKDIRKCKKYIKSVPKGDRVILIINDIFGQEIVSQIHQFQHIISIYVYTKEQTREDVQWTQQYPKIKGVIGDLDVLVAKIRFDRTRTLHRDEEPFAISILKPNSSQGKSTTELNGNFIHSEVSIDVLLRMKSAPTDKNELIELCKEEYKGNKTELEIIHEFEQDYSPDRALWWYTRESFLYRLLNKALRVRNIDILYLFRFFIRDIERQLEQYKCLAPIRVYRGQLMSTEELEILKNSIKQSISMNSFLSTSVSRQKALEFLENSDISDNLQRVFFTIDADPRLDGIKPFANIIAHSYFKDEEEVLMMLGSIFKLIDIHQNGQIWFIKVQLCGNNCHELKPIYEHMKNKYGGDDGQTDLLSFGSVLCEMGKFDDAEKYFRRLLNELSSNHPGIADCYHNLGAIALEKGDYNLSLEWYNKSLDIKLKTLESNHPDIAETHNSIGVVYRKKGDWKLALESYNKALTIFQRAFGDYQINIAKCFNNIGTVYQMEEKYTNALDSYQRALDIQKKHLPNDHPDMGSSHGNIGSVYQRLSNYDRALEHYRISLKILEKSLPPEHPSIAMTLKNMGVLYEDKNQLQQALTYFERAAIIRRHTLPATHPSVHLIEQDIQRVKNELKKY